MAKDEQQGTRIREVYFTSSLTVGGKSTLGVVVGSAVGGTTPRARAESAVKVPEGIEIVMAHPNGSRRYTIPWSSIALVEHA